ncbi:metallophosphoesterase family protein [Clostridium rectalis]|uniref:metallophosphoesterase family protein n=1 Tax=Clostridium rectalis TaxID=2040295 RepID=UPI000F62DF93|nr:metallophosphoesterase [Clostridium rectalis]
MKRKFKSGVVIVFSTIIMLIATSSLRKMQVKVKTDEFKNAKIVFPVISDIHIGANLLAEEKFKNALIDLFELCPDYDALSIVGDSTNSGNEAEYKSFMRILNANKRKDSKILIAMGNHEYYSKGFNNKELENTFVRETKMSALYYDKWIKGYHFIVLAPENNGDAILSTCQLNWLKNTIKENESKKKPIFVFLHQPFSNTVFGSNAWAGIENYEELYAILKMYPQVIFFSGHSHYNLDNEKTMYKKDFAMFNTGAINYIMTEGDGYAPIELSQGLVVEVLEDKVIVRCREFSTGKWIGKCYEVKF